jgi:hypothetical protein
MGFFSGGKTATKPRKLKPGASVPLVDVDPDYIAWVRGNKPVGKFGHTATVRVELIGADIVVKAGDGSIVGKMKPAKVPLYRDEFETLRKRGEFGVADIEVSPLGKRERVGLAINYDAACRDGGIL